MLHELSREMDADVPWSIFLSSIQQSGPRGYDKIFSTNWFHAQRNEK